jgi:hypothetical protein
VCPSLVVSGTPPSSGDTPYHYRYMVRPAVQEGTAQRLNVSLAYPYPYSVFDKVRQVKQADIVSNKQLGTVLKHIRSNSRPRQWGVARRRRGGRDNGGSPHSASARSILPRSERSGKGLNQRSCHQVQRLNIASSR